MSILRFHKIVSVVILLTVYVLAGCKKSLVIPDSLKDKSYPNWTHFGGWQARNNNSQSDLKPPLENIWTYKATSAISPTLLAIDGLIYLITLDGRLDVVDIATGMRVKRTKLDDQLAGTCAYFDGDLYIAYRYGSKTLCRLDLETGKYLWKIDAGDIASEPLVTASGIFISALYKHVDRYDLTTGERKWTFKTEDQHHSSPVIGSGVLVVGCDNGALYALNTETGKLKWEIKNSGGVLATPIITNEMVYVGSKDSTFSARNLEDGTMVWRFQTAAPIFQSAATNGEVVIFGTTAGRLYCLSAADGKELWNFSAKSVVSTAPLIVTNTVYFGALDKNYYALSLDNGQELWHFTTKGRIRTSPVVWGNYLIGASEDKYLYAFTKTAPIVSKSN